MTAARHTPNRCAASVIRGRALGYCTRGAVDGERYCPQHLKRANDPDPHGTWLAMRAKRLRARRLAEAAPALLAACEAAYEAMPSLMDEVTGKRATDWGKVNNAIVALRGALAAAKGKR